jgi:hypothetical protein
MPGLALNGLTISSYNEKLQVDYELLTGYSVAYGRQIGRYPWNNDRK